MLSRQEYYYKKKKGSNKKVNEQKETSSVKPAKTRYNAVRFLSLFLLQYIHVKGKDGKEVGDHMDGQPVVKTHIRKGRNE